ncbi:MAG: phosphoribosylaminoimidazole succinocarboxamide synthase [Micavibrio sp.]|nr:MAG: phosphoribosylaminoimidazole succinocarboxamide synthase [Micavibrio sp.]
MTQLPEIMYRGSVKDIRGDNKTDHLIFEFSDRYSVFDWGGMPDRLDGKGEALAALAYMFFDLLEKRGIKTHLKAGQDVFAEKTNLLTVEKMAVLKPEAQQKDGKLVYDYSAYKNRPERAPTHTLVPLEVIFRFGVPEGSSLLKRASDAEYCKTIGLATPPKAGDMFDSPVIEFSTKLENYDRMLPYETARDISGMTEAEFKLLHKNAAHIAEILKDIFAAIDVTLWDGKLEFAFDATDENGMRGFILIDSIGPDELRLTCEGVQLSKESLRKFYRGTSWEKAVARAKELAEERGAEDWKSICMEELKETPPPLDPVLRDAVAMLYKSMAQQTAQKFYRKNCFENAWPLKDVARTIADWGKKHAA